MNSFLYSVAEYLYCYHKDDFKHCALVFPNRRSGVFFLKHLQQIKTKPIWLPQVYTINEFIEEQSQLALADNLQLLAVLYKTYINISKSKETFDDFYLWGEIMLNDFNDIDKYMIEPAAIFKNIKEIKNIESGIEYLTEEQIEVLKRFFSSFNPERNSNLKENFLKIWNYLLPVYDAFNKNLEMQQLTYEGALYRLVANNLIEKEIELKHKKCFFIGFNAITKCEERIFESLKRKDSTFFFWDYDSYYIDNQLFQAGTFLRQHLKNFPSPANFQLTTENLLKNKNIKVISTSTNNGQAFKAGAIINDLEDTDYTKTALVLGDETLLLPALNYLPNKVNDINITMGYAVKDTLTGNFIELLISLHNSRHGNQEGFYYKFVLALLRHPFLASLCPDQSIRAIDAIENNHWVQVKAAYFADYELLSLILSPMGSSITFSKLLGSILLKVQEGLTPLVNEHRFLLDYEQLFNVHSVILQLENQIVKQKLDISIPVYFKLLRKVIYSLRIPFEGEPVNGLQVMGFLETRNLDFDNLIILAANDNLLPSSNTVPSFIPYGLRKGFGLPVRELHDAMYAYYFYRIIQRAKNITLIYNSGAMGMSTGEKSRFIQQLIFDPHFKVVEEIENQMIDLTVKRTIQIEKAGLIEETLNSYLLQEKEKKISPSAISTYLTCPLKFYYQQILGIRDKDETTDSIDARLFGNIFHYSAEAIYKPFFESRKPVTHSELKKLVLDEMELNKIIHTSFIQALWGKNTIAEFELKGRNLIVFDIIKKYLIKMLEIDQRYAPFDIIGLETCHYRKVEIIQNGQKQIVVIGGQIDRLDRTSNTLRIIDYKTGSDQLGFSSIDEVFSSEKIDQHKASMQTLIYGYVCAGEYLSDSKISPGVYKVKDFFNPDFSYQIYEKSVGVFSEGNVLLVEHQIKKGIQSVLNELFDYKIPFKQTSIQQRCTNCIYKIMCGK